MACSSILKMRQLVRLKNGALYGLLFNLDHRVAGEADWWSAMWRTSISLGGVAVPAVRSEVCRRGGVKWCRCGRGIW